MRPRAGGRQVQGAGHARGQQVLPRRRWSAWMVHMEGVRACTARQLERHDSAQAAPRRWRVRVV
jgi:hypothetical protein